MCRGLACWCFSRQYIALTLRGHKLTKEQCFSQNEEKLAVNRFLPKLQGSYATAPTKLASLLLSHVRTESVDHDEETTPASEEEKKRHLKGLIVVAGQTSSGKSTLLNGLLRQLLPVDCNHIIALGKPVDWQPEISESDPGSKPDPSDYFSKYRVHYTPRTLTIDTTLKQALQDALRQHPAAVYLDEVRDESEWHDILRFADSGHLIVTTTHSGSVREAVTWILESAGVRRRSQAPEVARKLLAVIHARREGPDKDLQRPEIWFGKQGAALFGAYGPGSLIPECNDDAAYIAREHLWRAAKSASTS